MLFIFLSLCIPPAGHAHLSLSDAVSDAVLLQSMLSLFSPFSISISLSPHLILINFSLVFHTQLFLTKAIPLRE